MRAIHFELISYVSYLVMVLVLTAAARSRRDYWYALIGCTATFPFEWLADRHWMFLEYDQSFVMLFDRLPMMMPAAYGWFFAFPLLVCLLLERRIDRLPLGGRIVGLFVWFFLWDVCVEYSSTSYGLWVYQWKKEAMIGGVLPWFIPAAVAPVNVGLYFAHKMALARSAREEWFAGLLTHTRAYYLVFVIQLAIGWPLVRILGIHE